MALKDEGLNSEQRLTRPMVKQDGKWIETDWAAALDYVSHALRDVAAKDGAAAIGALLSPHATLEELYLAQKLMRGIGSDARIGSSCALTRASHGSRRGFPPRAWVFCRDRSTSRPSPRPSRGSR